MSAVGLEEEIWIGRFEQALSDLGATIHTENDWAEFAENVRRSRGNDESASSSRWIGVAIMLAMLVILGWSVWKFVLHGRLAL